MLLVEPVREIIRFIPHADRVDLRRSRRGVRPAWGLIGTAAVIALGISRWLTTRYRITPTVVEVRRGSVQRKHLTVPRDRVRTVDVSAHPLQRLLRLVKVADRHRHLASSAPRRWPWTGCRPRPPRPLRAELLHRDGRRTDRPGRQPGSDDAVDGRGAAATEPDRDADAETVLARLDPRWIGYAPATLSGVVTGGGADRPRLADRSTRPGSTRPSSAWSTSPASPAEHAAVAGRRCRWRRGAARGDRCCRWPGTCCRSGVTG